jgi:hypothetical protein
MRFWERKLEEMNLEMKNNNYKDGLMGNMQ